MFNVYSHIIGYQLSYSFYNDHIRSKYLNNPFKFKQLFL